MPQSGTSRPQSGDRSGIEIDYGRLEQRVYGMEQAFTHLASQLERDRTNVDHQFSVLQSSLAERSKIPWPALGVVLSAMVIIGGMAWYPIKESQAELKNSFRTSQEELKTSIQFINASIVPRTELQERWRVMEREVESLSARVTKNSDGIVPRGEHEEKWRTYTVAHADHQRQIDLIRNDLGGTYNLRDALKAMQDRLERIEHEATITQRAQSAPGSK